jgi:hypothetical protein
MVYTGSKNIMLDAPKGAKKIGEIVLIGSINTNTYQGSENRLQLFDGKFNTGYRIISFDITPVVVIGSQEHTSVLSTEPNSTLGQWDFRDVEQVAWAAWNVPTTSRHGKYDFVRPDNMIIEDLWINGYAGGEAVGMNYMIILEKYQFSDWMGAGFLVENLSQSGPN